MSYAPNRSVAPPKIQGSGMTSNYARNPTNYRSVAPNMSVAPRMSVAPKASVPAPRMSVAPNRSVAPRGNQPAPQSKPKNNVFSRVSSSVRSFFRR